MVVIALCNICNNIYGFGKIEQPAGDDCDFFKENIIGKRNRKIRNGYTRFLQAGFYITHSLSILMDMDVRNKENKKVT